MSLSLSGCTVLGFIGGTIIDNSLMEEVAYPPKVAFSKLSQGDEVLCVLKDSSKFVGSFAGAGWPQGKEVLALLRDVPEKDCAPGSEVHLGDRLYLKRPGRQMDTVIYIGADERRLSFRTLSDSSVRYQFFKYIENLSRCDGTTIPLPLRQRYEEGVFLKDHYGMRIRTESGTQFVDSSKVAYLQWEGTPMLSRLTLTVLGFFIDFAVLSDLRFGGWSSQ